VKHLSFFGLFPDATGLTSLRAINMGLTRRSAGIGAATKKTTTSLIKL